jgi:putative ubiquitin-RnfH superfamily antitoxin RatB of RatAB toxin-antitoxin module
MPDQCGQSDPMTVHPECQQIPIQVCFGSLQHVFLLDLMVPEGTSVIEAIEASHILKKCPEIDLDKFKVGIFGKLKSVDVKLNSGDRIEIYRSLIFDPMEARRQRAINK